MKCETSNRNSIQMIVEHVDIDPSAIKPSVFTPTDDTSRQGLMATNFTSGRNSNSKYMRTTDAPARQSLADSYRSSGQKFHL